MLNAVMLSVCFIHCQAECQYADCRYAEYRYAEYHYAEYHYAEYRYAEYRYAKCRAAYVIPSLAYLEGLAPASIFRQV